MRGKRWIPVLALCLAIGTAVSLAYAQDGFDLSWWTVDGGGRASTDGPYRLSGTSGQADAGDHLGGDYTLHGGFWRDTAAHTPGPTPRLYLPLVTSGFH